jgi:hypothetical protein
VVIAAAVVVLMVVVMNAVKSEGGFHCKIDYIISSMLSHATSLHTAPIL